MLPKSFVAGPLLAFMLPLAGCLGRTLSANFGALPAEPMITAPTIQGIDVTTTSQFQSLASCTRRDEHKKCAEWKVPLANCGALTQLIGTPLKDKFNRDSFIAQWVYAIDLSHGSYLGKVSAHRASTDTASDLMILGVTAASAVSPSTAIGATATALAGAKASIDKNYYSDLSRFALLVAAQKSVEASESKVDRGLTQSSDEYSMGQACADLADYYRSASVVYAVGKFATEPNATTTQTDKANKGTNNGGAGTGPMLPPTQSGSGANGTIQPSTRP